MRFQAINSRLNPGPICCGRSFTYSRLVRNTKLAGRQKTEYMYWFGIISEIFELWPRTYYKVRKKKQSFTSNSVNFNRITVRYWCLYIQFLYIMLTLTLLCIVLFPIGSEFIHTCSLLSLYSLTAECFVCEWICACVFVRVIFDEHDEYVYLLYKSTDHLLFVTWDLHARVGANNAKQLQDYQSYLCSICCCCNLDSFSFQCSFVFVTSFNPMIFTNSLYFFVHLWYQEKSPDTANPLLSSVLVWDTKNLFKMIVFIPKSWRLDNCELFRSKFRLRFLAFAYGPYVSTGILRGSGQKWRARRS